MHHKIVKIFINLKLSQYFFFLMMAVAKYFSVYQTFVPQVLSVFNSGLYTYIKSLKHLHKIKSKLIF